MKKFIINADDFGINEEVTAEIEKGIGAGAISSTTVMANGTCLDEVKRFAALHPEVSFGVHLCLSEFGSITRSKGLYKAGLTDEKGDFVRKAIFRLNYLEDVEVRSAIKEELNAQIDVVSGLGIPVSHADSHHHVHTIYSLRDLFADVLHKRGIKRIRLGGDFKNIRMKAHLLLWYQRVKLNRFYKSQFITANNFYSYAEFVNAGYLSSESEIIELMCHPGHHGQPYRDEMILVESKKAVKEFDDAQLISYNELH